MDDEVAYQIDTLHLACLAAQADTRVLLRAIEEIGRSAGGASVQGVPVFEWFERNRGPALQENLRDLEDLNPELAARLQAHIDVIRKKAGLPEPE